MAGSGFLPDKKKATLAEESVAFLIPAGRGSKFRAVGRARANRPAGRAFAVSQVSVR